MACDTDMIQDITIEFFQGNFVRKEFADLRVSK